ncbi:DUF6270 domain-containing protein, partial [Vreelandella alkaliphila]|uniref:DUF6270 domain-containing protein n=1 Tax=Vreelandella alkaliphila TaxID=272774 RepID=UPI003FD83850
IPISVLVKRSNGVCFMNKVTVFGGCCSRDTFNFKNGKDIKVSAYYARTSVVSMLSLPSDVRIDTSAVASNFNRRIVDDDINKTALSGLLNSFSSGGMLIMDFMVERLNLIELEKDKFITKSSVLKEAVNGKNFPDGRELGAFSEERKKLFKQAWHCFYEKCAELGVEKNILINRIYLTKKIDDGSFCFLDKKNKYIDKVNNQLSFIYDIISDYIPLSNFIVYDEEVLVAKKNHKWGLSPFHFIDDFYVHQKNKISDFY